MSEKIEASAERVEHTPGPWSFEPFVGSGYGNAEWAKFVISDEGDGFSLATVIGDISVLPAEANARLISAAPDLLAAARVVLAGLNARIDRAHPSSVPVFDGIADLHAAIAKAEGWS